jgi:Holliday junction resolvase RusA-like endonuclease
VIELRVVGIPMPQGSKTAFVRNGRAVLVEGRRKEAREKFTSLRQMLAMAAHEWAVRNDQAPLDGPLIVTITFELPRPTSTSKRVLYPAKKPDLDKLVRGGPGRNYCGAHLG